MNQAIKTVFPIKLKKNVNTYLGHPVYKTVYRKTLGKNDYHEIEINNYKISLNCRQTCRCA